MTLDDLKRRVSPPRAVTQLRMADDGQTVLEWTIENCAEPYFVHGQLVGFAPAFWKAQERCLLWGLPAIIAKAKSMRPDDWESVVSEAAEAPALERRHLEARFCAPVPEG